MASLIFFSIYLLMHQFAGVKTEEANYLGCYVDGGHSDRLITGYKEDLSTTNSPEACIKLCHSKGFAIAAMQYEFQCFCGNTRPSFKVRAEESECNKECPGNKSKKCGGDWRLSVYKTGLEILNFDSSDKELEYIGCFIDGNLSDRYLNDYRQDSPLSLTPHYCVGLCYSLGHLYAGLQNGKECFCGDRHPLSESKVVDSQCSSTCSGDTNKKCGGGWRLSIYSTLITDYPVDGKFLGCFVDPGDKRILTGKKFNLRDTNSPRRCANLCFVNNYEYAGVQYNFECFCGNNKLPRYTISDNDCRLDCPRDSTSRCGGYWRSAIYRTDNAFEFNKPQYLGCFKDKGSLTKRLFKGYLQTVYGKLTPELCVDICRSKGFHYSATQNKFECFCDNIRPSTDLLISSDKCNSPCDGDAHQTCGGDWSLNVYKTGLKGPNEDVDNYVGCFKDQFEPNRLLKGGKYVLKNQNVYLCISHCLFLGYSLAGLQWKKECFCGDLDLSSITPSNESYCYHKCPGDSSKKCGGDLNLSVYKTGVTLTNENEIQRSYEGCFDTSNTILKNYKIDLENNSPQRCVGVCRALGYQFAGLEYGVQCFCEHFAPSEGVKVPDSECSTTCPGAHDKFCGGNLRMTVYSTHAGISISGLIGYHKNETIETCESTLSIVNGKRSCKNSVVFHETFDSALSRDTWHHTVKISDEPDGNFVVFSADERNSFTKDGKLHIKPTLLPDNVVDGHISLIGCTGEVGTSECTLNSTSYIIVPPVVSAELSTKNSFWFRYGIIEIIAKFPIGDWIIPELYLEPKHQAYGAQFLSGRIKIALAFGNENLLTKDGNIIDSHCLESGIVMGEGDTIRKRKITKCTPDRWNNGFHNYTIIWAPDDIQLVVDGEYQHSLISGIQESNLCAEIGLQRLCSTVWQSGSKIAPFDKDFYIKLGVTIGGNRAFPDDSLSNGQNKPWKNDEIKALYKFWNKTGEWFPTWTDPALQIDSIKVTTL